MEHVKLLIVGAGAAGLSAAVSAWEAGCRDILVADRAPAPGGVLPQCIHRGFGLAAFGEELSGPEYAERLLARLAGIGVRMSLGTEVLTVSHDKTAVLSRRGCVSRVRFERLILASGCREKSIGALPVSGTRPAGIFTAGQAQEMINLRHQDLGGEVLILGSGDLGMIMARRFVLEGKHVIAVLEQAAHYGGMARNYHRCMEAYQIPLRCRMTVREIQGQGRISGVTAEHLDNGEQEFIACDTLVTALGLIPERTLVQGLEASR
ncbi:MAG: FAD-dependent oxidoreductase [Oscillospiraceae bacterium]|nr:FAD-dependent oxidoreductase [Oscillospiraceae bacterium]